MGRFSKASDLLMVLAPLPAFLLLLIPGIELKHIGGLFEFAGLFIVVKGLNDSIRNIKGSNLWLALKQVFKQQWDALVEAKPKNVELHAADAFSMSSSSTLGTAFVRPPEGASIEEYVDYLEQRLEDLSKKLSKNTDRLNTEIAVSPMN